MKPEELQEIRERVEKATPGPWYWSKRDESGQGGPDLESATVDPYKHAEGTIVAGWGHDWWGTEVEPHNADFIAHARTDVPRLLDLIEKQREENEVLHEALRVSGEKREKLEERIGELEQSRRRLANFIVEKHGEGAV